MLVDKAARISSVQMDNGRHGDGSVVFWTELRAAEKGRSVVCSKSLVDRFEFPPALLHMRSFTPVQEV